jgi:hypothetical protein
MAAQVDHSFAVCPWTSVVTSLSFPFLLENWQYSCRPWALHGDTVKPSEIVDGAVLLAFPKAEMVWNFASLSNQCLSKRCSHSPSFKEVLSYPIPSGIMNQHSIKNGKQKFVKQVGCLGQNGVEV